VALRCPGELTKDLTLKDKDSKFVLEDISRPRTKANNNGKIYVILPSSGVVFLY